MVTAMADMKNPKTDEILRLFKAGHTKAEVARLTKCTRANVTLTIKRWMKWDGTIEPLPHRYRLWIMDEAEVLGIDPKLLVSRMIVSKIERETTFRRRRYRDKDGDT